MKSSNKIEKTFQTESTEHKTTGNVLGMLNVIRVGESIS